MAGLAARREPLPPVQLQQHILIWTQRPDATLVAGYTTWQKSFHRQVTRGEHGIRILAPVTRRFPKLKPDGTPLLDDKGKPVMATQIVGVKPTSVFDISQTTGDPVPEPPRPALLTGQAPDGLWRALATLVGDRGFRLERGDCHGANGYTDYTTRTVKIRDDVDDAQAVKTLAHELGHVLLHNPAVGQASIQCRGTKEVEAESVAHLVTAAHGLDSSQYTFTYVAGWAEQALPHHPEGTTVPDVIHTTGTRVLKTAHQILDATAAPDSTRPVGQALAETVARNVAADRTAMLPERAGSPVAFPASVVSRPAHQVEVLGASLGRESCSSTSVTVAGIWAPCERTSTFPAAQTNQTRADGTVALVVQRSASFARKPQAVAEVGGHPRQRVRLRTRGHWLDWLLVVRGQTWSSRHRPTAAINCPLQRSVFFRCHGPSHASSVVGMDSSASECSLRQRQESARQPKATHHASRESSGGHTGCSGSPASERGRWPAVADGAIRGLLWLLWPYWTGSRQMQLSLGCGMCTTLAPSSPPGNAGGYAGIENRTRTITPRSAACPCDGRWCVPSLSRMLAWTLDWKC